MEVLTREEYLSLKAQQAPLREKLYKEEEELEQQQTELDKALQDFNNN